VLECRKFSPVRTVAFVLRLFSLAFCELYITIASIFHRFQHLKGNELREYDLLYDDFFASHRPMDAVKFHVQNMT
jgi:hypothetical protein